jgi:hypothetical protein
MPTSTLIPKTHIIKALINAELPERHVTALGEFIDNALGSGAGDASAVTVEFDRTSVKILDNGRGIADINAMFTLGDSQSRLNAKDIGQFGYGAKVGALYLAYVMAVETVHAGRYHRYEVDWEYVLKSGQWPRSYRGSGTLPAPRGLKKGTRITLRRRHVGRTWHGDALAQHLAYIYRPALLAGRRITVVQHRGRNQRAWNLAKMLGSLQLEKPIHVRGNVRGMPYALRAGRTRNLSARLNGVHIAFGHRFIVTERALIERHIPAQLYAEVMLSPEWKDSLSANKSSLARNREELLREIERRLTPLIDELEGEAQEIEIRGFVLELAQDAEELIERVNEDIGKHGTGEMRTLMRPIRRRRRFDAEPGGTPPEEPRAEHTGDHDKTTDALHKKKVGVTVELASIGERVARVSIAMSGARVTLNRDLLYVRLIKRDKLTLLGTILNAILDECIDDDSRAASLFPKFKAYRDAGERPLDAKQHMLYELLSVHEASIH